MSTELCLFDTLSGTIRPFRPTQSEVKLYVCGVTPYDTAHLGHAFTYVAFDVLVRYLSYLGHGVRYVQNVTDVDDPLFEKARQLGVPYTDLAARETQRYLSDMHDLNVREADVYPRASAEIPDMLGIVQTLVQREDAYVVDGRVYFRVASDPHYGELSKLDRPAMLALARERGGDPDDPQKEDALDFLLWRPSREDEFHAFSPWGEGLPGWHLECSAMALKYLGAPIDIHGGGSDLVFPHHEGEIAQSEGATGLRPFGRFWMHTAMVYMDGEKMSKSLGNMVFVRDLVREHGSDAVRIYVSSCHYRSELHWDRDEFERACVRARTLQAAIDCPSRGVDRIELDGVRERFTARLSDDLDTPGALAVLSSLATTIESGSNAGQDVRPAQMLLRELGDLLGLRFSPQVSAPV